MKSTIINLCPTGMVPTKGMTPHVPITPKEIAASVAFCAELGASIAHIHPRDDEGKPTADPEAPEPGSPQPGQPGQTPGGQTPGGTGGGGQV